MIKKLLKKHLRRDSLFYKLLSRAYNINAPKKSSLVKLLEEFSMKQAEVNFVQIGSNDGKTGDPLYRFISSYYWKGILIEPVPYIFEKLKSNYSLYSSRLKFENVAIGKEESNQKFYFVSDSFITDIPWVNQLGSLDKETILSHKSEFQGIENHIEELLLPVRRLESVLDEYKNFISIYDLIHIDAEGYDFEILMNFDLQKYPFKILIFEHIHIPNKKYRLLIRRLKKFGYNLFWDQKDTFGVLRIKR